VHVPRDTLSRQRGHFTNAVGALRLAAADADGRAPCDVDLSGGTKMDFGFGFMVFPKGLSLDGRVSLLSENCMNLEPPYIGSYIFNGLLAKRGGLK